MARSQVLVALLRGVNVGGRSILKMAELRELAEGCGFDDVQTYLQSGNLVFRTTLSAAKATTALQGALRAESGRELAVAMRTAQQLAAVVEKCPFRDTKSVHVTFVVDGARPTPPEVDPEAFAPERFEVRGREIYLHLPDGMGRSRLAQALAKGQRGANGTTRSWKTVTALAALTDQLCQEERRARVRSVQRSSSSIQGA